MKLWQLTQAANLSIATPNYVVTNDFETAREFVAAANVVAKPLSPGIGIAPFVDLVCIEDLDSAANFPTFFQALIPATADLRVVVIGDNAWTWRRKREPTTLDWRQIDPSGTEFEAIGNDEVSRHSIELTRALGLSMSVQDWLEAKDGPMFLEVNPQGSWLFLDGAEEVIAPALARHLVDERA